MHHMRCDRPFCARMPIQTLGICNSCGDKTHKQHDALATRLCVHCHEHGHDEASVPNQNTEHAAGQSSETLRASNAVSTNARTKCKGAIDPKRHNKTNCRETMDRICAICEECGSSKCQSATNFYCPEHKRSRFMQRLALSPEGRKLHITKLSTVPVWAAPNLPRGDSLLHSEASEQAKLRSSICPLRPAQSRMPNWAGPPPILRISLPLFGVQCE